MQREGERQVLMCSFNLYRRVLSRMIRPPTTDSRNFVDTTPTHSLEAVFAQFQAEVRP